MREFHGCTLSHWHIPQLEMKKMRDEGDLPKGMEKKWLGR
jgi:hypothetical protein